MKEVLNQETIQKILKRVASKKASDPLFTELLVMANPIATMTGITPHAIATMACPCELSLGCNATATAPIAGFSASTTATLALRASHWIPPF